ncbi:DEAD/DEAH box helicase [Novosphingobium sp. ST904]|uniref:DEAD/DEAH box helicase n=1 Tax=Novosphingobium sp. ST904 TaxID=1684385 RepID=UPI0006C8CBB6|nr:DEAD/DEAH box helicase [Novosphingobium sp. ST904]KPH60451.1 DEAD/DEAH box helicase [Novosphingobium sp. ST904]TCM39959.1 superfamily II DNA/RNA helicase [Novosphingobium sp. ST904]
MNFADLGLSDELLQAVETAGYSEPTPIQAQAIPPVLMMKDLIGIAQTGTGKTASFVLPMIDVLAHGRRRALMPRSLILEPTRELAAQVAENFEKYGKNHDLRMALLIGGVQMGDQIKALQEGVDVLIATPGRLMDLFERGKILLTGCELLVIDEADRMLDMGFIPDIESICSKLPTNRQTLLFSATMPPPIKKLADRFLSNPKYIEVARPATANTNIVQHKVAVPARKKREALRQLLRTDNVSTAIIFANRKTTVRELAKSLKGHGFAAGEIHGDMEQPARLAELQRFKDGSINILVASDVAARGLDVKGVSHVFNFDTPWHPDDYVHRIGRTGRGGATGRAFTFVAPEDAEAIENVEKLTGGKIPVYHLGGEEAAAEAPEAAARAEKPRREKRERAEPRTEAKAPREERAAPREERAAPREERAERAPRRESRGDEQRRERRADGNRSRRRDAEPADDGWNGPIPEFLSVSALT